MTTHAILTTVSERPGMLHAVTRVLAAHSADIKYVDIHAGDPQSEIYLEFTLPVDDAEPLLRDLRHEPGVASVAETPTFGRIYGKRVIVMGGGAQVGMVAMGAIAEADRHNIRGERISVDTIPLVGEQDLAAAVRAVARLPRARVLVLAGSIMGGTITDAVREVQAHGIIVISLNMVGSVRDAADLVVTDPLQAGVMAVMSVADTARFDISRQRQRRY